MGTTPVLRGLLLLIVAVTTVPINHPKVTAVKNEWCNATEYWEETSFILQGDFHVGMSEEQVLSVLGKPDAIETLHSEHDIHEFWTYKEYGLYFRNGILQIIVERYI